jgi:hypothetical protein
MAVMILVLCASNFPKSKPVIVENKLVVAPLKIDGLIEDWDRNALNSQKKVDFDYAFMNDAENLYVLFIFKIQKFLSSISMTEMTIWISSEKKEKKDYGKRFIKKKISTEEYISMLEKKMGGGTRSQKKSDSCEPSLYIL